jgi:hypothetical protein
MIVKLLKPHTDAGKYYLAGDTLDVDEATLQWLIKYGVAEVAPDPQSEPEPDPQPEPKGD